MTAGRPLLATYDILLMLNGHNIEMVKASGLRHMEYHAVTKSDKWRINLAKEVVGAKWNQTELNGFKREEIDEMLVYVCTT